MSSPTNLSTSTRWRTGLRWVIVFILIGIILLYPIRASIASYQSYRTLAQLIEGIQEVDTPTDLIAMRPMVNVLRANLIGLERAVSPMMPVLQQLTFVPRYGQLLATLDELIAVGIDATITFDKGIELTQNHVPSFSQDTAPSMQWVVLGENIAPLADELAVLQSRMDELPLSQIGGQVGNYLSAASDTLELATFAVELGPSWPDLLGNTRPSSYLLLVQNNHELRATGGFISAVALITVINGVLQPVEFVDSYEIFSRELAYPPAPPAMKNYMGIELLTLRDANWSPHLPSAGVLIRTLYQQHTGLAVDGIITVDLDAVALLLPAFNRLTLPESTIPITQQNVEEVLVQLWNNPLNSVNATSASGQGDWWSQRKDFVGQLTAAAFARIQQRAFNPLFLAGGIAQGLDRRSVQVWLFDPEAQDPLIARNWDGGLHPQRNADFLAIVDSNLGYNKADVVVARQLDYQVAWPADTTLGAEVTLTLTYTHPINRTDPVCKAVSYYGTRYEDMMARCYFNYSRVYVPGGSELLGVDGWLASTVSSERAEQGTQVFAGYFVLNPNNRHQVTIRYRLPATIRRNNYQLVIQRQSGTNPLPISLHNTSTNTQKHLLVGGQFLWKPKP